MTEIYMFEPLLKQTIWGGNKIKALKQLDAEGPRQVPAQIGESWEISGVEGSESIVACGPRKGQRLNQLVSELGEQLLGHDNYLRFGNEFPLLVKFIDARDNLSIQVHPSDETARRQGLHRGKTEMWYVLPSEPGARLTCGFNRPLTPQTFKDMVADNTIAQALATHQVAEGDVFFIPAGRIHSIGAGCFVAEIQQASDVTYRIYDYQRRDCHGRLRQLHTEQAAQSLDFATQPDYRTHYTPARNRPVPLVECPFFTTALYDLDEPMRMDYSELDSFVILMCVKGQGTLTVDNDTATTLRAGQTVLLPAIAREVVAEGSLQLLETFV